jgi:type IV secretion system protein VirD4
MSLFTDSKKYPYRAGALFLGVDGKGREVGISTERHAITVAGSRSGKGAALLIPNARRWPHNLLVVDPKGENASASWEAREALGQSVHVLDPFKAADVPERLRASFNPLGAISINDPTGREDIEVIADGLVKRSDPKDEEWYSGAVSILAGIMAFVVESAPPEHRTFAAVRSILLQTDDALKEDAERMLSMVAFGGLARATGIAILTAISTDKSMERAFLGGARRASAWMDSPPVAAALASSSFTLSSLKTGNASVFLVLPPKYLETHAAFLRLFVRSAIDAMMQDGAKGRPCLFLLDEFFALGRLDIVAKSAGLMGGYGLHLWPFLQDLGQLKTLYGENLSDTFFGNADAQIFFGNSDVPTLDYVSRRLGVVDVKEIGKAPTMGSGVNPITGATVGALLSGNSKHTKMGGAIVGGAVGLMGSALHDLETRAQQSEMNAYQQKAMTVGRPRLSHEEIQSLTGKGDGDTVARSLIAFAKAGDALNVQLVPYFAPPPKAPATLPKSSTEWKAWGWTALELVAGFFWLGSVVPFMEPETIPPESRGAMTVLAVVMTAIFAALFVRHLRNRRKKT